MLPYQSERPLCITHGGLSRLTIDIELVHELSRLIGEARSELHRRAIDTFISIERGDTCNAEILVGRATEAAQVVVFA